MRENSGWDIEESGPRSPSWNMHADSVRLDALEPTSKPFLRFYEWDAPSATYGYFVDPWDFFDQKGTAASGLVLAKRPTGGGIIFHLHDLAFSIIVPSSHSFYSLNSLYSYEEINRRILQAVSCVKLPSVIALNAQEECSNSCRGGFCMAKPTKYDLLIDGRKCGGAAQRKTKNGLLHQGSLCLLLPKREWMEQVLKQGSSISEAIEKTSYPLGEGGSNLTELRSDLKWEIIRRFTDVIN